MVQWLRFHISNVGGEGLIPVQGTKIPHMLSGVAKKIESQEEDMEAGEWERMGRMQYK